MGDRDTREDAIRLATEAAKRNALEQVATYLESITIVEQSFQQLQQIERGEPRNGRAGAGTTGTENGGHYPTEQYLIGKGQGDLNKGKMVASACQSSQPGPISRNKSV